MLISFQQFLAACIGNTKEETDSSVPDAQQRDERQTESEVATDDNSTNNAESAASDSSDTSVSEPSDTENIDAPSESEETPAEDDAPLVAIDDDSPRTQQDSEGLPISIDEGTHASGDDTPGTPSADETSVVESANLAPSDDETTESSEDTAPVPEGETEPPTEIVISEQGSEGAIAQHAQISDVEAAATGTQETGGGDDTKAETTVPEAKRETPPIELGIIEDIYDFVEMFGQSTVSGTDQASVSGTDCSGGVTKPAIFEHPTPTETAKIDYTLSLPDVDKKEKLFLHFSTGLRDGVAFDDARPKAWWRKVRHRNFRSS